MSDHAESFDQASVSLLNGQEFCEAGGCELERMSEPHYGTVKYVCWTCKALWSVRITGLGPAWWRTGTIALAPRSKQ